jgi:hypothetical protein
MEEQITNEETPSACELFTVNTAAVTSAELVAPETTEVSVEYTCDPKNEGNATQIIQENLAHRELLMPVITERSECVVKSNNGELVVSEDSEHATDEKSIAQDVLRGSTVISVRPEDMLQTSQSTNIFNEKEQISGTEDISTASQNDLNVEKILMNAPMVDLLGVSLDSLVPVAFDVEELQKMLLPCMQESNNAQYTLLYWPTNSINPEETGNTYVEKIKSVTGNNDEMEVFSQENQQETLHQDGGQDAVHEISALITDKSEDVTETSPNNMASDAAQVGNRRDMVKEIENYTLRNTDVCKNGKCAGYKRRLPKFDSSASGSDANSTVSLQLPVRSSSMHHYTSY